MIYVIADRVGKLACEVEEKLTAREMIEWNVFLKMENEAHKKAVAEAKRK